MRLASYRILLDGKWTLKDFYELPHTYNQLYAFMYVLNGISAGPRDVLDREWATHIFEAFPWRGGYSAVGFYNALYGRIPVEMRPQVKSISYASPGWIELSLAAQAATHVAEAIAAFAGAGAALSVLYTAVHKGLRDRKLLRLEVKRAQLALAREQVDFIVSSVERLSELMGFGKIELLAALTPNSLATLKVLLSFYRRVRRLHEFVAEEKARFPVPPDDDDRDT